MWQMDQILSNPPAQTAGQTLQTFQPFTIFHIEKVRLIMELVRSVRPVDSTNRPLAISSLHFFEKNILHPTVQPQPVTYRISSGLKRSFSARSGKQIGRIKSVIESSNDKNLPKCSKLRIHLNMEVFSPK